MPRIVAISVAVLLAAGSALLPAGGPAQGAAAMAFTLSSPAFQAGAEIPQRYTCEGTDVSPPLAWSAPPAGARSLALIVDDPDAPDPRAPKTTWTHWVLYDMPPSTGALPEGASHGGLPAGAKQALNDWNKAAWGGPCPPIGRHRYFFRLYALDRTLPDMAGQGRAKVEAAFAGHVLARAELVGTYQKRGK